MALNISSNIVASEKGRELVQHGSALFPIACYAEDLSSYSVAWHWHEEFEYVLCTKGPLHVDVKKTRLTLQTGQGVFINSGVLHAVEQAPEGTALLHSGVFHPRLVGGMDTIFWQKLIRPMTQSDAPPFFLLDGLVPWQKQVLDCLHESWKAVSDEPFDYENRVRYYLSLALRLLSTQCVGGRTKVSQQEQIASERMKQDRRDRRGVRLHRWQLLYQDLPGDKTLYAQRIPYEILLRCEKRRNLPRAAYIDIWPHHRQHPAGPLHPDGAGPREQLRHWLLSGET